MEHIRKAKEAVDIPIIPSLNGISTGGWTSYAKRFEEAGADAVELNVYFIPTNFNLMSYDVEDLYVKLLKEVKKQVSIPVAMKLSPYFSAMPHMASMLDAEGADALVLFNRFYQPDIDIEELEVTPNLQLSTPVEMRLPMRWIAILYGHLDCFHGPHQRHPQLRGRDQGSDGWRRRGQRLLGAAQGRRGQDRRPAAGRDAWMDEHEYESIEQMKGSMSHKSVPEPAAFERANYMKVLNSYK